MIVVHHLVTSQSERIVWLLEELQLPYRLVVHHRNAVTQFAPAVLRDIHPLGQAPVIEDGDVVLAESLAITTYILELYGDGRLRIALGNMGYSDYLNWLNYAIGGLMPQVVSLMTAQQAFSRLLSRNCCASIDGAQASNAMLIEG